MRWFSAMVAALSVFSPVAISPSEASPVTYDPALYTFLDVGAERYGGGINNHDEIVYEDSAGTIETTLRGDVTVPGTSSVRFPAINDHGEVVYAATGLGAAGFRVVSIERGLMTPGLTGNLPSINNNGRILYVHSQTEPAGLYITDDGIAHTRVVAGVTRRGDINDAGTVVYEDSGTIMRLEEGGSPVAVATGRQPVINNHGDILYLADPDGSGGQYLFAEDGTQLTPFPIGFYMDMNDHGDVVFTAQDAEGEFHLVLATQHPTDFDFPVFNQPRFCVDSDGDGYADPGSDPIACSAGVADECPDEAAGDSDADSNGCPDTVLRLPGLLEEMGLTSGWSSSLYSKALGAVSKADRGLLKPAANMLGAIRNEVEAQRGKRLSEEDADLLIEYVENVLVALATPPVGPQPLEPRWEQLGGDLALGGAVAMSNDGSTVIVGSGGSLARVHRWNDATGVWDQVGGDIAGPAAAVAMSGDGNTVIAGARRSLARVHRWNDAAAAWVQLGSDINRGAVAVAMSDDGDTVIVGELHGSKPLPSGEQIATGAASVYRWNDSAAAWVQLGDSMYGDREDDRFGRAVAMSNDGNAVIIGGPRSEAAGYRAGLSRVHRWDGTSSSWVQVGEDILGAGGWDLSGFAVAMSSDGNTVIVGADGNADPHARVFRWSSATSTWVQLGRDLDGGLLSVAMSGDGNSVIVPDPFEGVTRAFRWDNASSSWVRVGDDFTSGAAAAMSDDGATVIVGARVYRLVVDSDGDGVADRDDVCAGTIIPDPTIPTEKLGTNRWALVDDDGAFDTFLPEGKVPRHSYTTVDTGGCNAEQIADALQLGKDHYRRGLSTKVMNRWVTLVGG